MTITSDKAAWSGTTAAITPDTAPSGGSTVVVASFRPKTLTVAAVTGGWTAHRQNHPATNSDADGGQLVYVKNGANSAAFGVTFTSAGSGSIMSIVNDAEPVQAGSVKFATYGWGTYAAGQVLPSQQPTQAASTLGGAHSPTNYPRRAAGAWINPDATGLGRLVTVLDERYTPETVGQPTLSVFTKAITGTEPVAGPLIWPYGSSAAIPTTGAEAVSGDEQPILSSWLWESAAAPDSTLDGGGDVTYIERPRNLNIISTGPDTGRLSWAHDPGDEFVVYSSTTGAIDGTWTQVAVVPAGVKFYDLTGLPTSSTLYLQVKARRVTTLSAFAGAATVSIAAPGFGPAPPAPTIDFLSPGTSPRRIAGKGVAGSTLLLYVDAVLVDQEIVDSAGDWVAVFVGPIGTYSVTARQSGPGGTSADSAPMSMSIVAQAAAYDVPRSGPIQGGGMLEVRPPPVTAAPLRPDGMVGKLRIPGKAGKFPGDE
jgi:hypothetical protein